MAPLDQLAPLERRDKNNTYGDWRNVDRAEAYIIEAWGEGFMLGALLIMAVITIANMRKGVILHKLILLELLFAMSHGTFCFMAFTGYGWYLSGTATLLYCSYFTHNVVAWLKIRPFFASNQTSFKPSVSRTVTWVFLTTLAMSIPVLIFEIFNNFRYFNNLSKEYVQVRPYEPLMRDPWWIFSCLTLFHVIRKCYSLNILKLMKRSPRFGVLLVAICMAIIFTIVDILASILPELSVTDGINPYWKLALVFKCLTDNIMLDDFKSVLQRLGAVKLDGSSSLRPSQLNITPNEKVASGEWSPSSSSDTHLWPGGRDERTHSISGRALDDGEVLDAQGRARRRQSMAARGIGKLGMRISKLPGMASFHSKEEREAQKNAEKNKTVSEENPTAGSSKTSQEEQPTWNMRVFAPDECQSPTSPFSPTIPASPASPRYDQPDWEHMNFVTAPSSLDARSKSHVT